MPPPHRSPALSSVSLMWALPQRPLRWVCGRAGDRGLVPTGHSHPHLLAVGVCARVGLSMVTLVRLSGLTHTPGPGAGWGPRQGLYFPCLSDQKNRCLQPSGCLGLAWVSIGLCVHQWAMRPPGPGTAREGLGTARTGSVSCESTRAPSFRPKWAREGLRAGTFHCLSARALLGQRGAASPPPPQLPLPPERGTGAGTPSASQSARGTRLRRL